MSDWISDFRVDVLISDWISADSVRDFFRDGALVRNIQMMYNTHTTKFNLLVWGKRE